MPCKKCGTTCEVQVIKTSDPKKKIITYTCPECYYSWTETVNE